MSPDEDIKLIIANRIKPLPIIDYRIVKSLNFPKPRLATEQELNRKQLIRMMLYTPMILKAGFR